MASYEVHYLDPYGNLLEVFPAFERLEYTLKENEVGVMSLDLPRTWSKDILRADARLEIWRTLGNRTYLVGNKVWFLEDWRVTAKQMHLECFDANWLLEGPFIDYASGTTNASCTTMAIDDAMKDIVRGALTTDATSDRDISAWLSVDPNFTLAPETTKAFSRRSVLATLQELAAESRERGTYLSFDIEYVDNDTLCFKTYKDQRGIDHSRDSANPIILSENNKSLEDATYEERHSSEITHVEAGGQGVGSERMTETATDTARAGRSPFGRREKFIDARMCSTSDALVAEAKAELEAGAAIQRLTGKIMETDGLQYGIHYDFGDLLVAEFENLSFDAHVDTIHITVENGREEIDNRIVGYL